MGDVDYVLSVRAVSGGAFVADVGATRFLQVPAGAGVSPDQTIGASAWYNAVQAAAAWTNAQGQARGDLLFVVHGYNSSEADVMQHHRVVKSGLMALGFRGVVVSFDWPSDDQALAYLADRHRAKKTALKLVTDGIAALSARQKPDCAINIHLLCHSTGAYVVREAFDDADDTTLKQQGWTVSQILFAAGDISSASMSAGNPSAASVFNHCGRVGLPDDAPASAIEVDCSDYYAQLTSDPSVMKQDQPGGIAGAQSHSWYFGNALFTRDLFATIIGIEDSAMTTRRKNADGVSQLVRDR